MTEVTYRLKISLEPDSNGVVEKEDGPESDTVAYSFFKAVDSKAAEESRVTVGLAYPHSRADKGVASDGHIDFASPVAIQNACWAFTSKSRSIGLNHQNGTEGHGEVVESGLHRGPDWIVKSENGSETVIVEGDWVMAVRWDPQTWELIKSKRLNGFSPQGRAKRGTPTPESLANLRSN